MSRASPQRPPSHPHPKLDILLALLTLVFYPTEPLPQRRMRPNNDSTRWTFPCAALPAVCEQRHVIDDTITPTNESAETDYDQILDLIDSYV